MMVFRYMLYIPTLSETRPYMEQRSVRVQITGYSTFWIGA